MVINDARLIPYTSELSCKLSGIIFAYTIDWTADLLLFRGASIFLYGAYAKRPRWIANERRKEEAVVIIDQALRFFIKTSSIFGAHANPWIAKRFCLCDKSVHG